MPSALAHRQEGLIILECKLVNVKHMPQVQPSSLLKTNFLDTEKLSLVIKKKKDIQQRIAAKRLESTFINILELLKGAHLPGEWIMGRRL